MIEMRRNGIHSSSEIKIVREVDCSYVLIALGNSQTKQELTSKRVCLSVELLLSENVESVSKGVFSFEDLRGDGPVIKASRDLGLATP